MSLDFIESDLNEYTPSLLNPRSEKMDTASQINRRYALSLKKKPLNKRRDSAKICDAENIEAEVENMKNLPKIDENLNFVIPSQSDLNSQKMDETLASSQVIFKYPQNIDFCQKCQFPSPTNLHEINCAGPAVSRPECEKREKCYSGIPNHYLKYKHTILAMRNAEISSQSAPALISPILSQTEVADSTDKSKVDNYDICNAPTQIIHNEDYTSKSVEAYFEEDIFDMPTQKLISENEVPPKRSTVITTATITAGFIDGVGPELNLKCGESRTEENVEDSLPEKSLLKSNVIVLAKNSSTNEWESFRYGTPRRPKMAALKPTEKASSNSIQQAKAVSEKGKKTATKRSLENNVDTIATKLVKTTNTNKSIKPPDFKSQPDKEFVLQKWFSSFAKYEERQRNINLMSTNKSKRNEYQISKTVDNKTKEQQLLNKEYICDVDAETVILEDPQIQEENIDASSSFEKAYPVIKELLPGGRKVVSKTVDTLKTSKQAAAVASSSHRNNSDYFSMSESEKSNEAVDKDKSKLPCRNSEELGSIKLVIDGVYGRMVFNAEVNETGWKNVSVEGTKNLTINNNDLKQCNCNRNMEAHFTVKDRKCKGKVEKQRNDLPLEEKLKVLLENEKKKSEEEADSDVEIIEWETKCQSNLDRIINEAKSCGLNLDFPIYIDSEDDDNIDNEKNRRKAKPRSELKKKLRTQKPKSCSITHKKPIC